MRITLREGRKRQIREMCALVGLPVVRIVRIRIGTLLLGNLKPREWRLLSENEVAELKRKPGARKPETRKPEVRKPEALKPGVRKPTARKPEARKPGNSRFGKR